MFGNGDATFGTPTLYSINNAYAVRAGQFDGVGFD